MAELSLCNITAIPAWAWHLMLHPAVRGFSGHSGVSAAGRCAVQTRNPGREPRQKMTQWPPEQGMLSQQSAEVVQICP